MNRAMGKHPSSSFKLKELIFYCLSVFTDKAQSAKLPTMAATMMKLNIPTNHGGTFVIYLLQTHYTPDSR
jgi:hypothetical protein